jgi:putative glutamine amidotransferase
MKKPLIAATCRSIQTEPQIGAEYALPFTYVNSVSDAGGIPVIVPAVEEDQAGETARQVVDVADGVLLTGTGDIDPAFYGETRGKGSTTPDRARDALEIELVKTCLQTGLPVLGICRGIQVINVALGGTLFQDLPIDSSGETEHMGSLDESSTFHSIEIIKGTRLQEIIGTTSLMVNTTHHQAIKDPAPGVVVNAVCSEDGVIEGVEAGGEWFAIGVQWHPERMKDESCSRLFKAFVEAAGAASR